MTEIDDWLEHELSDTAPESVSVSEEPSRTETKAPLRRISDDSNAYIFLFVLGFVSISSATGLFLLVVYLTGGSVSPAPPPITRYTITHQSQWQWPIELKSGDKTVAEIPIPSEDPNGFHKQIYFRDLDNMDLSAFTSTPDGPVELPLHWSVVESMEEFQERYKQRLPADFTVEERQHGTGPMIDVALPELFANRLDFTQSGTPLSAANDDIGSLAGIELYVDPASRVPAEISCGELTWTIDEDSPRVLYFVSPQSSKELIVNGKPVGNIDVPSVSTLDSYLLDLSGEHSYKLDTITYQVGGGITFDEPELEQTIDGSGGDIPQGPLLHRLIPIGWKVDYFLSPWPQSIESTSYSSMRFIVLYRTTEAKFHTSQK